MDIRSILCVFGGSQEEMNGVNAAIALAKKFEARVRFLHVSPEPSAYIGVYGPTIQGSGAIIEAMEEHNRERLKKAKQCIISSVADAGLPCNEPETLASHHASAQFVHTKGFIETVLPREGRTSDLIVIGREKMPAQDIVSPCLFNTGKPILLMPPLFKKEASPWQPKIACVAWNGTVEASRALTHAMPLLRIMNTVHLLHVQDSAQPIDLAAHAELRNYLHTHGIRTDIILIERKQRSVGEALLAKSMELKTDLLVMGAYGHGVYQEMILGGATNYMLGHAEIPLLLSH